MPRGTDESERWTAERVLLRIGNDPETLAGQLAVALNEERRLRNMSEMFDADRRDMADLRLRMVALGTVAEQLVAAASAKGRAHANLYTTERAEVISGALGSRARLMGQEPGRGV